MCEELDECICCKKCFDTCDSQIIPEEKRYNICVPCAKKVYDDEFEILIVCKNTKKISLIRRLINTLINKN